ncbi:MAG: quinone oxidoreductase family protein [Ilumatobacteraceae bacterium]
MRAARLHEIGGTLQIDEIDDPVPAEGEVVVDVAYASVNPLDIWVTRGAPGVAADNLPWIPGSEASGHVDGRAVLVRGAGLGVMRQGLYRQRAAVPQAAVHDLPDGIDLAQAAGMPVVGITAWHAVHSCAQVTPDDRVLVLGASGGVGSVAVQLAAAAGATVWGQTGHAANCSAIAADGAAEVLVTDAAGLADAASAYAPTVVLDPLGGEFPDQVISAMANRGRLVVYGTSDDTSVTLNWRQMYRKAIQVIGYSGLIGTPESEAAVLDELLAAMAAGRMRIRLASVLPLAEAADAHAMLLERRAGGKLVLDCTA